MGKLELRMRGLIGKYWDLMLVRSNMLHGNVIRMLMHLVDKNAQLSLLYLLMKIG